MGNPDFVLVFQKSDSHIFLEKTAEISGFQRGNLRYFIERYRSVIVLRSIGKHLIQPVQIFILLIQIGPENPSAEIVIKLKHHFKQQTVETQNKSFRTSIVNNLQLSTEVKKRTPVFPCTRMYS